VLEWIKIAALTNLGSGGETSGWLEESSSLHRAVVTIAFRDM
jgi:hypothetical protein